MFVPALGRERGARLRALAQTREYSLSPTTQQSSVGRLEEVRLSIAGVVPGMSRTDLESRLGPAETVQTGDMVQYYRQESGWTYVTYDSVGRVASVYGKALENNGEPFHRTGQFDYSALERFLGSPTGHLRKSYSYAIRYEKSNLTVVKHCTGTDFLLGKDPLDFKPVDPDPLSADGADGP